MPILMTAAGRRPGADSDRRLWRDRPGSEIQTPMAIVILCGLPTSTLLNMFVVPILDESIRPSHHRHGGEAMTDTG